MKRKRYTPSQKAAFVLELFKEEETLPQIASHHGVHPNLLRKWKALAVEGLPGLFADDEQERRALESEHQRQLAVCRRETPTAVCINERWRERRSFSHPVDFALPIGGFFAHCRMAFPG